MRGFFVGTFLCSMLIGGLARAQNCQSWPTTLTNGQAADASQVMGDLNYLASCTSPTANPRFTGSVGIGTAAPAAILHVKGASSANATSMIESTDTGQYSAAALILKDNVSTNAQAETWLYQAVEDAGNSQSFFAIGQFTSSGSYVQTLAQYDDNANFWSFYTSGVTRLTINSSGNVGIGTSTPSYPLDVAGQIRAQNLAVTSDGRLKKDIVEISRALDIVERLRGVRYRWRDSAERDVGKDLALPVDEPQIGFIAQEVEAVVPEAVNTPKPGSGDTYSLKEAKLLPILVEAIKEQQAEIQDQQQKLALQGARMSRLESELAKMQSAKQ